MGVAGKEERHLQRPVPRDLCMCGDIRRQQGAQQEPGKDLKTALLEKRIKRKVPLLV